MALKMRFLHMTSGRILWCSMCLCTMCYLIIFIHSSIFYDITDYGVPSDTEFENDIHVGKAPGQNNYSVDSISDLELNTPPVVLIKQNGHKEKFGHYLTVRLQGRLGNMIFAYASLLGIAQQNQMLVCIPEDSYLRKIFSISADVCPGNSLDDWPKFYEYSPSAYDSRTAILNPNIHIELVGYFQSWKYFDVIQHVIKDQLTFDKQTNIISQNFLRKSAHMVYPHSNDIIFVGIHVRRTDMLVDYNAQKGYTVADPSYFLSAMTFFKARYHNNKIIFVVCSDNLYWASLHLSKDLGPVVFSAFSDLMDETQDLSLLSQCNHTIMSVGTYSWWAAWLAGGTTVYYKHYPNPGSELDKLLEPQDYFYPNWIGM